MNETFERTQGWDPRDKSLMKHGQAQRPSELYKFRSFNAGIGQGIKKNFGSVESSGDNKFKDRK